MEADSLLERRYRVLGRNSPLFYDKPLHLVRGEGVWLYDADGKRYLDAYNNVPHVGHCHPHVVAALCRQAARLNTHTRYLDENVVAYAERLTSLFDRQLSMAAFCCTGSEANELALRLASRFGLKVVYKRGLLAELRAAHGPEELERMERAIAITAQGHNAAARATVAGVSERDVQTQLEYAFFTGGATGLSYSSIVGSGPNGAVLHWDKNSRILQGGDLVVIDAAAEYGRYASDVTRTYPVSGHFTAEQTRVYRAVYQAQEDIFAAIKPGVSMAELQHVAEESLRRAGYLANFIHGFGHFVGLDVHDAGDVEKPIPVGAVFTVEPGVYLPAQGFGVRIEDEVVTTEQGYRLLTSAIPRKLEDVEAWVARERERPH